MRPKAPTCCPSSRGDPGKVFSRMCCKYEKSCPTSHEVGHKSARKRLLAECRGINLRLESDERRLVDAGGFVIVKGVGHLVRIEPRPRLLHRVAILDTVDRDHRSRSSLFP